MNIVFWLLIIVILVLTWFAMSSYFGKIGSIVLELFNGAREAMSIQEEKESKKDDDRKNNE